MRAIDMEIHVQTGNGLIYERLQAESEVALRALIIQKTEEWVINGIWSNFQTDPRNIERFYPPSVIEVINPATEESFDI